jgi:hypothetical protein
MPPEPSRLELSHLGGRAVHGLAKDPAVSRDEAADSSDAGWPHYSVGLHADAAHTVVAVVIGGARAQPYGVMGTTKIQPGQVLFVTRGLAVNMTCGVNPGRSCSSASMPMMAQALADGSPGDTEPRRPTPSHSPRTGQAQPNERMGPRRCSRSPRDLTRRLLFREAP